MSVYDKIAASSPINRQSAVVTGRGTGWTPIVKLQDWYDDPPPMKDIPAHKLGDPGWTNFVGRSFGNLRVLGLMQKETEGAQSSWVCRCVCGCYCTRKSKSLKIAAANGNSFVPECGRCNYQKSLASGWSPKKKARL